MKWIVENWALVSAVVVIVLNLAAVIVAKTTNKTDDTVVKVIRDILLRLSFVSEDANGDLKPGMPGFAKK